MSSLKVIKLHGMNLNCWAIYGVEGVRNQVMRRKMTTGHQDQIKQYLCKTGRSPTNSNINKSRRNIIPAVEQIWMWWWMQMSWPSATLISFIIILCCNITANNELLTITEKTLNCLHSERDWKECGVGEDVNQIVKLNRKDGRQKLTWITNDSIFDLSLVHI